MSSRSLTKKNPSIELSNGELFYYKKPVCDVREWAWACAGIPRFAARTKPEYSVLQHLILTARIAVYFKKLGDTKMNVREALFHDLHEAVMIDLPSPLKMLCPDYCKLEKTIYRAMAKQVGIPLTTTAATEKCDVLAFFLEADTLMVSRGKNYADYDKYHEQVVALKAAGLAPRAGTRHGILGEYMTWIQKSDAHIV